MKTSVRATFAAASAVLLCLTPSVAGADHAPLTDRCDAISFPAPGMSGVLSATLCAPSGRSTNTVMVLMPGSNYNHTYWDFPYAPQTYNFRRAMNAAGYATVVVDRLGTGASSRPTSVQVNSTGDALALHELVQALRRGLPGTHPFGKVIIGGVSLSSGIDVVEASTYHDVDGVVLTGYSHTLNIPEVLGVMATFHQAVQDPQFVGRGYDPGYLTTQPGTRAHDFFALGDADPQVVAVDEETKDVFAPTEYPDGLVSTLPGMTNRITVPVLVVDGSLDRLSCGPGYSVCVNAGTLYAAEAPYFDAAARLHTFVLPGSGHSVNLARNTVAYQKAVSDWADSMVR